MSIKWAKHPPLAWRQPPPNRRHWARDDETLAPVGLHKKFVRFEAVVHGPIMRFLPPTTCIADTTAMLFYGYCAIIDSFPAPPLLSHTAIHHTILVITISCEGQSASCVADGGRGRAKLAYTRDCFVLSGPSCTNQYYSLRTHPLFRYPTPHRHRSHYCAI